MLDIFKIIASLIKSFYDWWYGQLPVSNNERSKYIEDLIDENKKSELRHRIEHNFNQNDINVLTSLAIKKNKPEIIDLLTLSEFLPTLRFNGVNLLKESYKQVKKCFDALVKLLLEKNAQFSDIADQNAVKQTLDAIVMDEENKLNGPDQIMNSQDQKRLVKIQYNKIKRHLINLMPYKFTIIDEDITFEKLIRDLYEVHTEKLRLENTFKVDTQFNRERTQLANTFVNLVYEGSSDQSDLRQKLSYLDETINIEVALQDLNGYSLLTKVLDRENLKVNDLKMIAEMSSGIDHRYMDEAGYDFDSFDTMFNNLAKISEHKLEVVSEARRYIIKAFIKYCDSIGLNINGGIDQTLLQLSHSFLSSEDMQTAKDTYLYLLASHAHSANREGLSADVVDHIFSNIEQFDANQFINIIHLLPNANVLTDQALQNLLDNEAFAVDVLEPVLNNFRINSNQMMKILKFIQVNKHEYPMLESKIYILWGVKYSESYQQGLSSTEIDSRLYDIDNTQFDQEDWNTLFSINIKNYEVIKNLYGQYLFNQAFLDVSVYNPCVQGNSLTLLACAINQGSYKFAKDVYEQLKSLELLGNDVDQIAKRLSGVNLERLETFLVTIKSNQVDELLFAVAKQYLDSNKPSYVEAGLTEMKDLSLGLMGNIYDYVEKNKLDYSNILNIIFRKRMKESIESDLKLLDKITNYNSEAAFNGFEVILLNNKTLAKWSQEHFDVLSSIFANKPFARSLMFKFMDKYKDDTEINLLASRCMAGLLTPKNQDWFQEISHKVLDHYLLNTNEQSDTVFNAVEYWLTGIEKISEDVLKTLLEMPNIDSKNNDFIQKFITVYNIDNANLKYLEKFLYICKKNKVDLSKLAGGLIQSDLGLLAKMTNIESYIDQHKKSIYQVFLFELVSKASFDSESLADILAEISEFIDEAFVNELIDFVMFNQHMIPEIDDAKLMTLIENLPEKFVTTYVFEADSISRLDQLLDLEDEDDANMAHQIKCMVSFSALKASILNNESIASLSYTLNDYQLENVFGNLVQKLDKGTNNDLDNLICFMKNNYQKDVMKTLLTKFFKALPEKNNKFFRMFVLGLTKDDELFEVFTKKYLNILSGWNIGNNLKQFSKTYDVTPIIRGIVKSIEKTLKANRINEEHLNDLLNKLRIFSSDLVRPIIGQEKLLNTIMQYEITLPDQEIHLIGYSISYLLAAMDLKHMNDYEKAFREANLSIEDLHTFLIKERERFLHDYGYEKNNIEGLLPETFIMRPQLDKLFLASINYSLLLGNEENIINLFEWLGYDQIARNHLLEKNLHRMELNYDKLVATLNLASSHSKALSESIKSTLLTAEIDRVQTYVNNELNLEANEKDKLIEKIKHLNDLNDSALASNEDSDTLPSPDVILNICENKLTEQEILKALFSHFEGRQLFHRGHKLATCSFNDEIVTTAITKYLNVSQQCQSMMNSGYSVDLHDNDLNHLLSVNDDDTSKSKPELKDKKAYLDVLLIIIRHMMTFNVVECDKISLSESEKAYMLNVLEANGAYNWKQDMHGILHHDTLTANNYLVDNCYKHSLLNLQKTTVYQSILSGNKIKSLFDNKFKSSKESTTRKSIFDFKFS
ncbi:MAG: hypothetical protein VX835_01175 [Pseudomonadota bacterium]|nr:hypothetical protein [Pseudomonadota bacterium]